MIDLDERPLSAIPAEFSGRAKVVGCPWCRAALMLVLDESGRGMWPLEVHGYDLAEPTTPGRLNLKGGWMLASPHRCRPDWCVRAGLRPGDEESLNGGPAAGEELRR